MKAKKKTKKAFPSIAFLAICAILAVNAYALHELVVIARSWKMNLLSGSVSEQLTHLAIILGINCAALVYLLIERFTR
ncbi:MAG: hypothetical protein ACNA71_06790 [Kiritimatiellia bacterium]